MKRVDHVQALLTNVLNPHLFIPIKFLLLLHCEVRVCILLVGVRQGSLEFFELEAWRVQVVVEVVAKLPDVDQLFELFCRHVDLVGLRLWIRADSMELWQLEQ